MKYLITILLLAIVLNLSSQIHTDHGLINSGYLFIKLDRYKTNGELEGYRGMIDVGHINGVYSSILERKGGKVARFRTPFQLVLFMDFRDYEYIGAQTYVLRKLNKDVWTTVWIFYKEKL